MLIKTYLRWKKELNKLNFDSKHFFSNDDFCTPLECVEEMINLIPEQFWNKKKKILDPCCGNGNFPAYLSTKISLNNITMSDINEIRINNAKKLFKCKNIEKKNFFDYENQKFDLIVANPPYSGGGNKNKSLSNKFIEHSINLLNNNGYLLFICPNNWMTYNNSNLTLKKMLENGNFLYIDLTAKRFFPNVGSSFVIFLWQKRKPKKTKTTVLNGYLIKDKQEVFIPKTSKFLPLYLSQEILNLLKKSIINKENFVKYRCDLHNWTKNLLLNDYETYKFKYRTIHTTKQTRWSCFKQDIYDNFNIIIPLSTYFIPYIDHKQNVTQSVAYISFDKIQNANMMLKKIFNPLSCLIIHITRYGNFNNICLLKHLNYNYLYDFSGDWLKISTISTLWEKIKDKYGFSKKD